MLCLGQMVATIDSGAITVGLPAIQQGLDLEGSTSQWVINAFALPFGAVLLVAGASADAAGAHRLFRLGAAGFAVASVLTSLAPGFELFVVGRAAQGVCAGLVVPAALTLVTSTFSVGPQRNHALGLFAGIASFGFLIGVVVGGLAETAIGWRGVMLIEVPAGALAAAMAGRAASFDRPVRQATPTPIGRAAALIVGVMAIALCLANGNRAGWGSWETLIAGAVGLGVLGAFRAAERRSATPLVSAAVVRDRVVLGSGAIAVCAVGTFVTCTFVLTNAMQHVQGWSSFHAGLTLAPLGASAIAAGFAAPRLLHCLDARVALCVTSAFYGVSVLAVGFVPLDAGVAVLAVLTASLGLGQISVYVIFNILVAAAVPPASRGLASGFITTAQHIGSAFFLAVALAGGELIAGSRSDDLTSLLSGVQQVLVPAALVSLAISFSVAASLPTAVNRASGPPSGRG